MNITVGLPQFIFVALLHDSLEDQRARTDMDHIRFYLGTGTCTLIRELTDVFTKDQFPHVNREGRKNMEANRLSRISPEGQIINLLDRFDNLNDKPKKNEKVGWNDYD